MDLLILLFLQSSRSPKDYIFIYFLVKMLIFRLFRQLVKFKILTSYVFNPVKLVTLDQHNQMQLADIHA